jgi:uncharacterized protein YciI
VERFNRNDPFHRAGVWHEVLIQRFNKGLDARG